MPIKSIEELYSQVDDFPLVATNEINSCIPGARYAVLQKFFRFQILNALILQYDPDLSIDLT